MSASRLALLLALALGATATAGPVAVIERLDGPKIEAEVLGLANGAFILRDQKSGEYTTLPESEVRSMDFGDTPRFVGTEGLDYDPAHDLTPAEVHRMAEAHLFVPLAAWLQSSLRRQGRQHVVDLDKELAQQLGRQDLTPEARRDFGLARVLTASTLNGRLQAVQAFMPVRREFEDDPVVRRFRNQFLHLRFARPATMTTLAPAGGGYHDRK